MDWDRKRRSEKISKLAALTWDQLGKEKISADKRAMLLAMLEVAANNNNTE